MAGELGYDDLRGNALTTLGTALGLPDGEAAFRESIEIGTTTGDRIGLFRGWNNLASMLEDAGRMDEAEEAQADAPRTPLVRFNSRSEVIWSLSASAFHCMTRGDWDEAFRRHDEALAGAAQIGGHYQEATMLVECAWMRMARDEVDRARTDAARALAMLRAHRRAQGIIPVLASAMAIHVELDELDEARAVLGRLLDFKRQLGGWRFAGGAVVVDAAMRLGRGEELVAWRVEFRETRWLVAAKAFLGGDFDAAAATLRVDARGARRLHRAGASGPRTGCRRPS